MFYSKNNEQLNEQNIKNLINKNQSITIKQIMREFGVDKLSNTRIEEFREELDNTIHNLQSDNQIIVKEPENVSASSHHFDLGTELRCRTEIKNE